MDPYVVLLVDDDDDFRSLLGELLREVGYRVVEASSGVEALALLDEVTPNVMLLDLAMPTMNGWDLFRRLQERAELRKVPIVFLSGLPELAPRGGVMTVSKPLTPASLTALLDALPPAAPNDIPLRRLLSDSLPPSP